MEEITGLQTKPLVYGESTIGLVNESVPVPFESEYADKIILEADEGREELSSDEVEEVLENDPEVEKAETYSRARDIRDGRDWGKEKWMWPLGVLYFHDKKKDMAIKELELRDEGLEEEADEIRERYNKVSQRFVTKFTGAMGISIGLSYFYPLAGFLALGLIGMTGHNYGEMYVGMKIDSMLDEYDVD